MPQEESIVECDFAQSLPTSEGLEVNLAQASLNFTLVRLESEIVEARKRFSIGQPALRVVRRNACSLEKKPLLSCKPRRPLSTKAHVLE